MKTEYKLIGNTRIADFEASVEAALAEGWILQGGVSVANQTDHASDYWAQAMIRHTFESEAITNTTSNE